MSYAKREAFRVVGETCPAIDKARADLNNAIDDFETTAKTQTEMLRAALIDAFERIGELEDEATANLEKISSLLDEVDELKDEITNIGEVQP